MKGIFLSHNSKDKRSANKLYNHLKLTGIKVWYDEAELYPGDSLIDKIGTAINEVEYLGVLLTPNSVKSEWVKKEVEIALNNEIYERRVIVLPILIKRCDFPPFLIGKIYSDLSTPYKYKKNINKLIAKVKGEVLERSFTTKKIGKKTLKKFFNTLDKETIIAYWYVFNEIIKNEVFLRSTHWNNGDFYIDCPVDQYYTYPRQSSTDGIGISSNWAGIFLSSENDQITLTAIGKELLIFLNEWMDKNFIKH